MIKNQIRVEITVVMQIVGDQQHTCGHHAASPHNNQENTNNYGYDDISNKQLKSIKWEVYTHLTVIINESLLSDIFPDALNIAIVKRLF